MFIFFSNKKSLIRSKKKIKIIFLGKIKLFFSFINLILLICNIFILIKKNEIYINTKISFKSSDKFILNILNLSYKNISDYLNYKYIINKLLSKNIKITKNKKLIKFYCVDIFARNLFKIWIKEKLGNKFIIKYDKKNPDYLLFNIGKKHLNSLYNNAIKIAFYTENKIPDFNESDYLIGHPHINYLDRYFKYSMFILRNFTTFINLREKVLNNHKRNKFCAAVISHPKKIDGFRIEFINELNKYKKVDMGGLFGNNIGGRVKDKIKFLSQYKFSIAMENSMADGYITEKLPDSFIAGTIPIYYGDYVFDEYINPKSLIFIKGIKDIKKKIDFIIRIDNNDELYKKISKEKILVDNNYVYKIEKEFEYFLQNIFAQDKLKAYRINK